MHSTIVAVDIAEFGHADRTDRHRHVARAGLYGALESAFNGAGVAWRDCYHEDRGDGVLIVVDGSSDNCDLVTHLPRLISAALREHNAVHSEPAGIQLRMAVHAGEIVHDQHGIVGDAVNHAFRILEAAEVKAALTSSANVLALVVSSRFFSEVVRNCAASNPDAYRPVDVSVKETRSTAWMLLPDPDPSVVAVPPVAVRVRDFDDPVALGVHPSPGRARTTSSARPEPRPVPAYVSRDAAEYLARALTSHPFVMLVGDATAGKTRLAYEVIRELLPDHILIAPRGPQDIAMALTRAEGLGDCVVWLDDLEGSSVPTA